jgi:hypothetical protein
MSKKIVTTLFSLLTIVSLFSQDKHFGYQYLIDSNLVKKSILKLTSDSFGGRKPAEKGNVLAQEFIRNRLSSYGLQTGNGESFYQNIHGCKRSKNHKYFIYNDFDYQEIYSYNNAVWQDTLIQDSSIVFIGYGIHHSSYNDFKGVDISNKVVMLLKGNGPMNKYGVKKYNYTKIPNREYLVKKKVKAVFEIDQSFKRFSTYESSRIVYPKHEVEVPTIEINECLANRLLESSNKSVKQLVYEIEKESESKPFVCDAKFKLSSNYIYTDAKVNNVVAKIEGTSLKDEAVIVCAHLDHLGKNYTGKLCRGADDNASGVSAVLEIARLFQKLSQKGIKPRRSILFLFTNDEENGLYGAKHYVKHPIFLLKKTVACVNIDMIGGWDELTPKSDSNYVYALTGSYKPVDSLYNSVCEVNKFLPKFKVKAMQKKDYSSMYSRSDHYVFRDYGVDNYLFTSGETDYYHTPNDTEDRINYRNLVERIKLIYAFVAKLANVERPFMGSKKSEK